MPSTDHGYDYVPGLAGVPAAVSKVCYIDGKQGVLEYRGYNIEALAEHCIFQETAWLLLKGELPTEDELNGFMKQLRSHRRLKFKITDLMKCLPEGGHPMDAL